MNDLNAVVEAASAKAAHVDQEDYIQDGLRYCGKCHTPKQCIM